VSNNDDLRSGADEPTHPRFRAGVLMVGVVVLLIVLSIVSALH
jgi:hypothetical protein